jgi:hypothetical protein
MCVMDSVTLRQVSVSVRRFPPVSIIPPILHIHPPLHATRTGRPKSRDLKNLCSFRNMGSLESKILSILLLLWVKLKVKILDLKVLTGLNRIFGT